MPFCGVKAQHDDSFLREKRRECQPQVCHMLPDEAEAKIGNMVLLVARYIIKCSRPMSVLLVHCLLSERNQWETSRVRSIGWTILSSSFQCRLSACAFLGELWYSGLHVSGASKWGKSGWLNYKEPCYLSHHKLQFEKNKQTCMSLKCPHIVGKIQVYFVGPEKKYKISSGDYFRHITTALRQTTYIREGEALQHYHSAGFKAVSSLLFKDTSIGN